MDILALLQPIEDSLSKATLRQMSRVILAMLAMTRRVTMLGVARWAGKGVSYRTIQRFYDTNIPWAQVFWQFFSQHLLCKEDDYILAGDESVIGKAGKKTYGLDQFFSGLQQKVIPSLSFFVVSLVSVKQRHSYPACLEQTIRSPEEKAASKVKKEAKKPKQSGRNASGDALKAARTKSSLKCSSPRSCNGTRRWSKSFSYELAVWFISLIWLWMAILVIIRLFAWCGSVDYT